MRWEEPKYLEYQTVSIFLFIPRLLPINGWCGKKEWRWLEFAKIRQRYIGDYWKDCWWVDE